MKGIPIYKINGVLIVLLILLASILPTAVSGKNESRFLDQSDNLVEISVRFSGIEEMQSYNLKITREKYREIQRIFNDTLKSLMEAETDKEVHKIFKETIIKLKDIGIISRTTNISRLEEIVTGGYLNYTQQFHLVKTIENSNLTSKFDNIQCLICGEATYTFKMDFSNRVYDLLVRIPLYLITLLLDLFIDLYLDNITNLLKPLQYIPFDVQRVERLPLSAPISFVGTIYFGSRQYNPLDPHSHDSWEHPSRGSIWTMGGKGIKTWNGTFVGDSPIDPFSLYFPLAALLLLLETVAERRDMPQLTNLSTMLNLPIMLYILAFYFLPLWVFYGFPYPGVIGFTGLYIGVPFDGTTFFIGHALGVAIKEFRSNNET